MEDGCLKPFRTTSIKLIDPDHFLGDSIPFPRTISGYTDNYTQR